MLLKQYMNLSILILYLAVGAIAGAALVFLGKRLRRTKYIPSNSQGGAISWAIVALILFMVSGGGMTSAAMDNSTAHVKFIGQNEFESEVIKSSIPVLVDFYATWCGPCQVMSPRVDEVAGNLAGKVKFVKVNVDKSPGLAQEYNINGIPALLLFKNGKLVDTLVGLQSEAELKSHLQL